MTAFLTELKNRVGQTRSAYEAARTKANEAQVAADALATELAAYERILAAELRREGKAATVPPHAQPTLGSDFRAGTNGKVNKTDLAYTIIASMGPKGAAVDDLDAGFKERGYPLHRNYLFNITSRLKQQGRIEQKDKRYFTK